MNTKPYNLTVHLYFPPNSPRVEQLLLDLKAIAVLPNGAINGLKQKLNTVTLISVSDMVGDALMTCHIDCPMGCGVYLIPLQPAIEEVLRKYLQNPSEKPIIWHVSIARI